MFLVYGGEDELIKGYSEASFQSDRDNFFSQSGFVFTLNGGAVTWRSSKQSTIADSTTESEYITVNEATKEAMWIRKFIEDLGVVPSIRDPVEIFCDNESAVVLAKNQDLRSAPGTYSENITMFVKSLLTGTSSLVGSTPMEI